MGSAGHTHAPHRQVQPSCHPARRACGGQEADSPTPTTAPMPSIRDPGQWLLTKCMHASLNIRATGFIALLLRPNPFVVKFFKKRNVIHTTSIPCCYCDSGREIDAVCFTLPSNTTGTLLSGVLEEQSTGTEPGEAIRREDRQCGPHLRVSLHPGLPQVGTCTGCT